MIQPAIQQTYDNNSQIRTAVNRLTELLEWLHPDPSPDIFTVRDYRNRYPFTRLGPLATGDIDRYQRINRAVGNHVQMGLCEYHIGLIYLHEGAFRGAVQQFDLARQQWLFVQQPAAVCLSYLSRAVAQQQANHYEAALVSTGKVAGWLERARFADPFTGWPDFRQGVLAYVAELQATLRRQMDSPPDTAASPEPDVDEETPVNNGTAPPPQARAIAEASEAATGTRPEEDIIAESSTPLPIFNMDQATPPAIPIPGHRLAEDRYDWYLVEARPLSDFLPDVNMGDWLLVDVRPGLKAGVQDTEQPILLVMDQDIGGTIRVRPLEPKQRFQRIYLVTLANASEKFQDKADGAVEDRPQEFQRDQLTGTVSFSSEINEIGIDLSEILGAVVGVWRPMRALEGSDWF